MKRFSFLVLLAGMITFAIDTQCMFLTLRHTKGRLISPQQKRFCSYPTPLEQRMSYLENKIELQGNELALIKSILAKQNNNNQPLLYNENPSCTCKPIEYKWDLTHYGNQ
jgi:hypothetical protein